MTRLNINSTEDGDYRYLSPELVTAMANGTTFGATVASDCYAFAMTVFSLLTLEPPFVECTLGYKVSALVEECTRPSLPGNQLGLVRDGLWSLLERMWAQDANLRPNLDDVHKELVTIRSLVPSQ